MSILKLSAGNIARRLAESGESGSVLGVFSQGIYCRVKSELVLLHDAKWGYVPFGIAFSDFAAFSQEAAAKVGDTLQLCKDSITIGKKRFESSLECDVPKSFVPKVAVNEERICEIYAYVKEHGSSEGIISLIESNRVGCADSIKRLINGDSEGGVRLIGLGRGLTPSGDDFLCGFFSVLNALGVLAVSLREAIFDNLSRTTDISAAYLGAVLGRRYFTVYDRAVRAIFSDGDFKEDIDFILKMGASSGSDTLVGALTAAKYFTK